MGVNFFFFLGGGGGGGGETEKNGVPKSTKTHYLQIK